MSDTRLLAIDQGTTSSRAIVFDTTGQIVSVAQREFEQFYPADGWVEHDAEEIWQSTLTVCREALERSDSASIAAIGITNQRETVILWDRATGRPVHRAIVWQDRRTADRCRELIDAGHQDAVHDSTGLLLDPYFSASKLGWLLDNVAGLRERAERGELAFGTVDSFLLWRLTGGTVHATDATNASRTLMFNIHTQDWDDTLLALFAIPRVLLPEVRDCAADFGMTDASLFGRPIRVAGMAGDQQAALFGQACYTPGMMKSTYGTGCFAILNTGETPVDSTNRLLTTVGYRLDQRVTYALEGAIFVAGAAVQWLRDGLGVIDSAQQSEALAAHPESDSGVYLVPAFTGLGAPHWNPYARGALFGLTRDSGRAQLARAALESVCYQTHDLLTAMRKDGAAPPTALRVDGGMVANDWLLQCMADLLDLPVERPTIIETTALGAAYLAGLQVGVFDSLEQLSERWHCDRRCEPQQSETWREHRRAGWQRAVAATLAFADTGNTPATP